MKSQTCLLAFYIFILKCCLLAMLAFCFVLLAQKAFSLLALCLLVLFFMGWAAYKIQMAAKEMQS